MLEDAEKELSNLLKTFCPLSPPILGKHNAVFAATLASSVPATITLPTLQELRSSVAISLQGKGLPYPQNMIPQSYSEEIIGGMKSYVLRAKNFRTVPTLIMFYGGGFFLNSIESQ
jgi:hypothetical protein